MSICRPRNYRELITQPKVGLLIFVIVIYCILYTPSLKNTSNMSRPKLIVFDLDYTLWPFWIDTHITSPIRMDKNNHIVDGSGRKIKPYKDVPEVLEELKNDGYTLGIASRTEWPEGANQLLKLLKWNKYFTYKEIYPGRKTTHFKKMHEVSGIEYSDMMFFDDESRNINDLKAIGVTSILVPDGVNKQLIRESLNSFKQN